jgi:hypothetical protein
MASSAVRRAPARSVWVLVALLVILVAVVAYQLTGSSATGPPRASNGAGQGRAGRAEAPEAPPPDVRLSALGTQAADLADAARNPFRFGSRMPAGPAPGATAPPVPVPVRPPVQVPAPGGSAIALKFIGVVEAPDVGRIAALTDGTFVFHGREGEIIDGRYRIVSIGVESLVIERVDGTDRQTLRLTG